MQANVINTLGNKATVELVVPVDVVKKEYQKSFNKYAQGARIDGFRKGHIPKTVLMQRFGSSMVSETVEELFKLSFKNLTENASSLGLNLNTKILPEIQDLSAFDPDAELKFTCILTLQTELNIAEAKEINFEPIKIEISDEDFNLTLDNLRLQFSTLEPAPEDATVGEKDCEVTIDFEGFRDGVAFDQGSAQDFKLEMGRTPMIPGFCEQLVGHKVGEQFEIQCTFPENYVAEELRGATATFKITIKALSLRKLPEIDAEFIKRFNYKEGTSIEKFMADLKTQLVVQAENQALGYNIEAVFDKLMAHFGYDLFQPVKADIDARIDKYVKENILRDQKISGKNVQALEAIKPMFIPEILSAYINVTCLDTLKDLGVINIGAITDEEFNSYVEKRSVLFDDPEEFKANIDKNEQEQNNVRNMWYNDKLLQNLCNLVTVAEKSVDYKSAAKLMSEQERAFIERNRELALKWYPIKKSS